MLRCPQLCPYICHMFQMKPKTVPEIMSDFIRDYDVPEAKLVAKSSPKVGPKKNQIFCSQIPLYFHLRLAYSFAAYSDRLHCVHSRLLALAILAYTCHIPENVSSYIYSGLVEELVDVLQLSSPALLVSAESTCHIVPYTA